MREYTLSQLKHFLNGHPADWSPMRFVGHLMHNLHARHVAQDLAKLDNHMLADMGIYRSEAEHAAHTGITHDALEELEHARLQDHEDPTFSPQDTQGLQHTSLRSRV